ncbi:MAG TPA: hypothetical protein VK037_04035 [Pseudogracilibacillus sp.]|nr:hypothetical protein [Pseudogracilibacillus sp.]
MIVQIKGKVKYPITLDPSVWIFDDRKIILEELFAEKKEAKEKSEAQKTAELFDSEVQYPSSFKPPVNNSIKRFDREKALTESYAMPLKPFVENVEPKAEATSARLITKGEDIIITLEQLKEAYVRFSNKGKQLKEDGPIHLYFGDGSNKDEPFTHIKEIIIE